MRPPDFWRDRGPISGLLVPVSWIFGGIGAAKHAITRPWKAPAPVLCVGNLTVGGTGKTPVAISLAERLIARGQTPHFLSRGYGGRLKGPVRVDPEIHSAKDVGDEPLLLARTAPVWIGGDRPAAARLACAAGAGCLVMDDGFQNPGLHKDLALIVIDGPAGFGNGRVMPAGPLRENISAGLARAQAVVLIGDDEKSVLNRVSLPVLRSDITADKAGPVAGKKVVAFAGIGRPDKFFATLKSLGCDLVLEKPFPDHHHFTPAEIDAIMAAAPDGAAVVTTEKDIVRLPPALRDGIDALKIGLEWRDPETLDRLLDQFLLNG